jgi:hypothetical protein
VQDRIEQRAAILEPSIKATLRQPEPLRQHFHANAVNSSSAELLQSRFDPVLGADLVGH